MAWQPGAVGSGVGGMAAGDPNAVQAYTLQGTRVTPVAIWMSLTSQSGVMRFLQTEWHRHERDRNAWEIEREEMKKRIAGLEGESRTSKGLRVSLEKHVKILEIALKRERDKMKSLNKGEPVDIHKDSKELAREELNTAGKGKHPSSISISCR